MTTEPVQVPTMEKLLALDPVGPASYRNRHHQPNVANAVFGGQIAAQALAAADQTVGSDRAAHSLHGYFLRSGKTTSMVDYHVETLRDGRRFSARRVTATQEGRAIFSMECSYRVPLPGFSHQRPMETPSAPTGALEGESLRAALVTLGPRHGALFTGNYPIDVRLPSLAGFDGPQTAPRRHYWLRARGAEHVADPAVHRQMLVFLSDFLLVGAGLLPHTIPLPGPHVFVASLDHSVWFHRDVRCDDWLLFETSSPNAEGGVNLALGHVYDRAGRLVATLAQEALQYGIDPPADL